MRKVAILQVGDWEDKGKLNIYIYKYTAGPPMSRGDRSQLMISE